MPRLQWGQSGQKQYETGVDRGVLFPMQNNGAYGVGVPWNGLTTVTEAPSGAESNKQYADNAVYLNLLSAEEFGATIEAFMYPAEFAECDGTKLVNGGVAIGQQGRRAFGFAYRTRVGDDVVGTDKGYKIHIVYNALAAPSEKAFATINDSPEAITFSWELTTTPTEVGTVAGVTYKPTANIVVDSTKVPAANMAALEDALWGTAGSDARLPLPAEVIGMFTGAVTTVAPTQPAYNATTFVITIPTVTGVVYKIDGKVVTGNVTVPADSTVVVDADPASGYKFPANTDDDWAFTRP